MVLGLDSRLESRYSRNLLECRSQYCCLLSPHPRTQEHYQIVPFGSKSSHHCTGRHYHNPLRYWKLEAATLSGYKKTRHISSSTLSLPSQRFSGKRLPICKSRCVGATVGNRVGCGVFGRSVGLVDGRLDGIGVGGNTEVGNGFWSTGCSVGRGDATGRNDGFLVGGDFWSTGRRVGCGDFTGRNDGIVLVVGALVGIVCWVEGRGGCTGRKDGLGLLMGARVGTGVGLEVSVLGISGMIVIVLGSLTHVSGLHFAALHSSG